MSLLNSDVEMCRQCGGLCCQGHPGVWVDPHRFAQTFFAGKIFDEKHLPAGISFRNLGDILVPAPQAKEQGCIFLEEDGCRLPEEQRPCQCRALEPSFDTLMEGEMRCSMPPECGSQSARKNWQRYWQQLNRRKVSEQDHDVTRME